MSKFVTEPNKICDVNFCSYTDEEEEFEEA